MSNPTYANQGAVSTIADDALVMVVGSDGRYKPVSFANIAKAARETLNQGSLNLATNTSAEPTIVAGKSIFFPLTEALSAGEQVTFSFEIDYGSTRPYFEAYLGPTTGGGVSARNSINRLEVNNGFNSFTMVLTKDAATVGFYTQTGVTIKVSKVMVTRGNIPCAWTPLTENSRGGVIASISTTYDCTQKGGAHEYACFTHRDSEIGADGFLNFGTLESALQFIGRACEDGDDFGFKGCSAELRPERRDRLDNLRTRFSDGDLSECSSQSGRNDIHRLSDGSDYSESWGGWSDIFSFDRERCLATLEEGDNDCRVVEGKEVAL